MFSFKVDNLKEMKAEIKAFTDFLRVSGADDDEIFAGKLVACELITNVIRHGGDRAEFTGTLTGDKIIITVSAESLKNLNVERAAPDVFAESGRGLYIVRSLCQGDLELAESGVLKVCIQRR